MSRRNCATRKILTALLLLFLAGACLAGPLEIERLPALEQPLSNNAVALLSADEGVYLYTFLGLGSGKTWRDITSEAFVLKPGNSRWQALQPVPGESGRLAASAVSIAGAVWLFGGYTVDAGGAEFSTPGVFRIRPADTQMQQVTAMPVAVEDAVILGYRDRYIYMVSGWHNLGNVNLVQVLDTHTLKWAQATPWPGAAVFGHAGGISGDRLLVCDGVKIWHPAEGTRQFRMSDECWQGRIDSTDHRRIHWNPVSAHPGKPGYRMAAAADQRHRVVFAGGSDNPYNFNGTGYDGEPSEGGSRVFGYSFSSESWQELGRLPVSTMDHRGLPNEDGWYYLIGGMRNGQKPTVEVLRFRLDDRTD